MVHMPNCQTTTTTTRKCYEGNLLQLEWVEEIWPFSTFSQFVITTAWLFLLLTVYTHWKYVYFISVKKSTICKLGSRWLFLLLSPQTAHARAQLFQIFIFHLWNRKNGIMKIHFPNIFPTPPPLLLLQTLAWQPSNLVGAEPWPAAGMGIFIQTELCYTSKLKSIRVTEYIA